MESFLLHRAFPRALWGSEAKSVASSIKNSGIALTAISSDLFVLGEGNEPFNGTVWENSEENEVRGGMLEQYRIMYL